MLDFNKIQTTIKNRNYSLKYFIPRTTNMTLQGFRKSIINKTLKVSVLEEISKALDLPMRHWWDEEDILLTSKDSNKVHDLEREIDQLTRQVYNYEYTIELQRKTIHGLEEQLGIRKASGSK